jgi:hypothetical protein
MNVKPEIWGPSGWRILHRLSFIMSYEESKELFEYIKNILPCLKCRRRYKEHLKVYKFPTQEEFTKDSFIIAKWLYNVHNRVTETKHKNVGDSVKPIITFAKVKNLYNNKTKPEATDCIFLQSLVFCHPSSKNSKELYLKSLVYFLNIYTKYSEGNDFDTISLEVLQTKKAFKKWLQKSKNYTEIQLDQCKK